jgi:hypothetical protein
LQSDPALVNIFPHLKDYRKNLYDAGKITPWTDENSEVYDPNLTVPGVNYTYPTSNKKK